MLKELIVILLHAGFDPNYQRPSRPRTPLHCAIDCRYPEIVHLLLRAGSDTSLRDINGRTAYDAVKDAFPEFGRPDLAGCCGGEERDVGELPAGLYRIEVQEVRYLVDVSRGISLRTLEYIHYCILITSVIKCELSGLFLNQLKSTT